MNILFKLYIIIVCLNSIINIPLYEIKLKTNDEPSLTLIPGQFKKIYIEISPFSNKESQQAVTTITLSDKTNFKTSMEKYNIDTNEKRIIATYIGFKCGGEIKSYQISFIPEDTNLFTSQEITINIDDSKKNIIDFLISDNIIAPGSYGTIFLKEPLLNMNDLIIKFSIPDENKNDLKIDDFIIKSVNEKNNIDEIISNYSFTKFYSLNINAKEVEIKNVRIISELETCYEFKETVFDFKISDKEIISNPSLKNPKLISYIINDQYYISTLNTDDLIKPSFFSCVYINEESDFPSNNEILNQIFNSNDDKSTKFYIKQFISNSKPYFRVELPKYINIYHNYKYKCIIENNAYFDSMKKTNVILSEYFTSFKNKIALVPHCYYLYFNLLEQRELFKKKLKSLCLSYFNIANKTLADGYIDCQITDVNDTNDYKDSISICAFNNPITEVHNNVNFNTSSKGRFIGILNSIKDLFNITLIFSEKIKGKTKQQISKLSVTANITLYQESQITINLINNFSEPILCYYSLDRNTSFETNFFSSHKSIILKEYSNKNIEVLYPVKKYDNLGYNLNIKCSATPNFLFDYLSYSLSPLYIYHENKTSNFCNENPFDISCIKVDNEDLPTKNIPTIIKNIIIDERTKYNELTQSEKEEKVKDLFSSIYKSSTIDKIIQGTSKITLLLDLYKCDYVEPQICKDFKYSSLLFIKEFLDLNINLNKNNVLEEFKKTCQSQNLNYSDYFYYLIYQIGFFGNNGYGMDNEIIKYVFDLYNSLMNISNEIIDLIEENEISQLELIGVAIKYASSNLLNLIPYYEFNVGFSKENFQFLNSTFLNDYNNILNSKLIENLIKTDEKDYKTKNLIFYNTEINETDSLKTDLQNTFILDNKNINVVIPKEDFKENFKLISNFSGFSFMFIKRYPILNTGSYENYDYIISMNILQNNTKIYSSTTKLKSAIVINYSNIKEGNYICYEINLLNSKYSLIGSNGEYDKDKSILTCKLEKIGIHFMTNGKFSEDNGILLILGIISGVVIFSLGGFFGYKNLKKKKNISAEENIALTDI
jgi:hypothetical protein